MAAVVQIVLLGCNGPDSGIYYSTSEREEERKPQATLGLSWGSFRAGI